MENIVRYEKIAMIKLSESEHETLSERFDTVIADFCALDEYDTTGVEPLVSVLDVHNIMRDDIPMKAIQREELLKNAPEQYDGYFQVPATIE